MTADQVTRQDAATELLRRRKARKSFLAFLQYVWWMPHPLIIGRHTRVVAAALDKALDNYLAGQSSYLDVRIPFRHGKSDLVSRAFVAYFLARCFMHRKENLGAGHDPDVIMCGYGDTLVQSFSKDCKAIIVSPAFRALFSQVHIQHGSNSAKEWRLAGCVGKITAAGLGGPLTGKGGDLIVLDDHTKSWEEARSEVYREKNWNYFDQSLFTRRAPVSIVAVVGTPWHVDDIQGRIKLKEGKDGWPAFTRLAFPGKNKGRDKRMFGPWLFPKRFPAEWYTSQYAVLGKRARALLECDPQPEGGNRFNVHRVVIHDTLADFPSIRMVRAWDLASSKAQRDKDDPDWTVGMLGGLSTTRRRIEDTLVPVHELWVADVEACQEEAGTRDKMIRKTAVKDGGKVRQVVESYGAYKDAFTSLRDVMRGITLVYGATLPGDKSAKAAGLEPIFDAGKVHLLKAPWNEPFLDQFKLFPDGPHDDYVDPAAIIYHYCSAEAAGIALPGLHKEG